MSSFIAHSLIGFAIGRQEKQKTIKETIVVSAFFIILACSPDIDYLITYLIGHSMPMRYTHSIGYILLIGIFSLLFRNILLKKFLYNIPIVLFFITPLSHLILDFLVGVHANPYLFPFSNTIMVFPFGVLPSAGHIDINNYYFWRNLLIELIVFIPITIAIVPSFRIYALKYRLLMVVLILSFLIGIVVGFNLER